MANVTNTKDTIADFYRRHPHAVRGMEASILALTIELVYNKAEEEDQIKKKLRGHPIGKKLLATGFEAPQIMEAADKQAIQLQNKELKEKLQRHPIGKKLLSTGLEAQ